MLSSSTLAASSNKSKIRFIRPTEKPLVIFGKEGLQPFVLESFQHALM
jgi:hypothetical protein